MLKSKKSILVFTAIIILACIGLMVYKAIDPVYLISEPWLGRGIYKIMGIDSGEGLIWSPNGKYLAGLIRELPMPDFCLGCGKPHSEIFIVDLDKKEKETVLWVKYPDKDISTISWFPDGEQIAYTDESLGSKWGIRSISVDGTNDVQYMADNGYPLWNPNHPIIAMRGMIGVAGNWYPVINIIDLSTKEKELIFKGPEPISDILSLSWSADGSTLAFAYGKIGPNEELIPKIFFFDLETKKVVQFTNDKYEYWSADFSPTNNIIALQRISNMSHVIILKDLANDCEVELPIIYTISASWSPDGQKIVVSGGRDAYIVNLAEYFGTKFIETGSICP